MQFLLKTLREEAKHIALKETANFPKQREGRVRNEDVLTKMMETDVLDREETNNKFFCMNKC